MRILVGCEESQTVCKAFRELGHEAFSCDIQECSGGHPEWHFNKDIFEAIDMGWDMMIAHPPCTYLSFAGNRWFNEERYGEKAIERKRLRENGEHFFLRLWNAPIKHICLENPKGSIQRIIPYTQIIEPYYFGDECSKTTLLWLKGLPKLIHNKSNSLFYEKTHVKKGQMCSSGSEYLFGIHTLSMTKTERSKHRSKTFPGIATAMATQWSNFLIEQSNKL